MIYILDDTISQRRDSIGYLQESPYSDFCKIVEFPTLKHVKAMFNVFMDNGCHMICIHRSLMLYNDDAVKLDNSETLRNSIINQANKKGIDCVVFGRETNNNKEKKFVDKDLFYRNLKLFLEKWYNGIRNVEILYEGAMYKIAHRKNLLDEIITIVNMEEYPYESPRLLNALREYIPDVSPNDVVSTWMRKEMTKKDIRRYINEIL